MAEYVNVMEQKRRMCNSYALCSMGCPLNDIDFCNKNSGEKTNANFTEVERRIMSWAAEHPEQVYPTWIHWLKQQGVIGEKAMQERIGGIAATIIVFNQIAYEPIPADIVEKLGVKPKEGKSDD